MYMYIYIYIYIFFFSMLCIRKLQLSHNKPPFSTEGSCFRKKNTLCIYIYVYMPGSPPPQSHHPLPKGGDGGRKEECNGMGGLGWEMEVKNCAGFITSVLQSRLQVNIAPQSAIMRVGPYWPLQHNFKPLQQPSQL